MYLLAAKIAVLLTVETFQAARLPSHEVSVWNQLRPSVVTMIAHGRPAGVAALIDDSGYFVAHSSSVYGQQPMGTTSSGRQIGFSVVSQDKATMLVLLKTNDWVAGSARPLHSPGPDESGNTELIAVLPNGPLRMGYGSRHKLGVLNNPTRRLVPLTEIRFEATPESVGGALIFSASGDLIGSLNATLVGPDSTIRNVSGNNIAPGGGGFGGARGGPGGNQGVGNFGQASQIGNSMRGGQYGNVGPNEMTVAYTVSPDFVKHVLEGFLSPAHSAEFAVLGIFCTDAIGGGAQIQSVTPGSPASKAGLHPGDVLLNIASNPIQDQMAFAAVMLQQKVGKKISLVVQRGPGKLLIDVVPARAAD